MTDLRLASCNPSKAKTSILARARIGRVLLVTLFFVAVGWVLYRTVIAPRAFAAAVGAPDQVVLWEGLPHPRFERRLFDQERGSKPTRELYGYSFYQADLPLTPDDAAALTGLLADSGSYAPYWPLFSAKLCGGFHPDYAIEIRQHGQAHYALVCLGCGEAELHGGWIDSKHNLLEYAAFKAILSKYRGARPPSDVWPDRAAGLAPSASAHFADPPASGGEDH